jgi:hypothetical protein
MSGKGRSEAIAHDIERTPNRAMLHTLGFGEGDFEKPAVREGFQDEAWFGRPGAKNKNRLKRTARPLLALAIQYPF